jgi:WD40 repeat protein
MCHHDECRGTLFSGNQTNIKIPILTFIFQDQFLISSSSNFLYIHQIGLAGQSESDASENFWFKRSATIEMDNCKTVNTFSAVNDFHSYIVLAACSDRSLRIIDLNKEAVTQVLPRIHQHKVHKILQVTSGCSQDEFRPGSSSLYNIFITGALSDGIKLWDLRQLRAQPRHEPLCVQRFDWPGSDGGRLAPGFDLSPCLKYLTVASEDGFCYVFDTRKPGGGYIEKLTKCANVQGPMLINFLRP